LNCPIGEWYIIQGYHTLNYPIG